MTDTEREEYELAALAAGVVFQLRNGLPHLYTPSKHKTAFHAATDWKLWNPKSDPGDSLRLAVKLEMTIDTSFNSSTAMPYGRGIFIEEKHRNNNDPLAATMLAIFRAAVEIGRAMKEKM